MFFLWFKLASVLSRSCFSFENSNPASNNSCFHCIFRQSLLHYEAVLFGNAHARFICLHSRSLYMPYIRVGCRPTHEAVNYSLHEFLPVIFWIKMNCRSVGAVLLPDCAQENVHHIDQTIVGSPVAFSLLSLLICSRCCSSATSGRPHLLLLSTFLRWHLF